MSAEDTPLAGLDIRNTSEHFLLEMANQSEIQQRIAHLIQETTHPRKLATGEGYGDLQLPNGEIVFCKWQRSTGPDQTLTVVSEAFKHTWIWALLNHDIYGKSKRIRMPMLKGSEEVLVPDQGHLVKYKVILYEHVPMKNLGEVLSKENADQLLPTVIDTVAELHALPVSKHLSRKSGFEKKFPWHYRGTARHWFEHATQDFSAEAQATYAQLNNYLKTAQFSFKRAIIHGDYSDHNIGVPIDEETGAITADAQIIPFDLEKSLIGCAYEDYARLLHRFMGKDNLKDMLPQLVALIKEKLGQQANEQPPEAFRFMRVYKCLFLANHWKQKSTDSTNLVEQHSLLQRSKRWLDHAQHVATADDMFCTFDE